MKLDVLMEYEARSGIGRGALAWTDPFEGGQDIQLHLIALLYCRILCVHRETQQQLFERVNLVAIDNVRTEGAAGYEFAPWRLNVGLGGGEQTIWPWELVELEKPKPFCPQ